MSSPLLQAPELPGSRVDDQRVSRVARILFSTDSARYRTAFIIVNQPGCAHTVINRLATGLNMQNLFAPDQLRAVCDAFDKAWASAEAHIPPHTRDYVRETVATFVLAVAGPGNDNAPMPKLVSDANKPMWGSYANVRQFSQRRNETTRPAKA